MEEVQKKCKRSAEEKKNVKKQGNRNEDTMKEVQHGTDNFTL